MSVHVWDRMERCTATHLYTQVPKTSESSLDLLYIKREPEAVGQVSFCIKCEAEGGMDACTKYRVAQKKCSPLRGPTGVFADFGPSHVFQLTARLRTESGKRRKMTRREANGFVRTYTCT